MFNIVPLISTSVRCYSCMKGNNDTSISFQPFRKFYKKVTNQDDLLVLVSTESITEHDCYLVNNHYDQNWQTP